MAQVPDSTLKSYFEAGDQPTASQFADFIDSKPNVSDVTLSQLGLNITGPGYEAIGNGTTDDVAAFLQANTDLHAAGGGVIYGPYGKTFRIADDIAFYDDVFIYLEPGTLLAPAVGVTLSNVQLANPIPVQKFSGSGTVVLSSRVVEAFAEWWGAKGDDEAHDDQPAIQKAVNSNRPAHILEKTYWLGSTVNLSDYSEMFGDGVNSILKMMDDANVNAIRNLDFTNGNVNIYLHDFAIDGNKDNQDVDANVDPHVFQCIYMSNMDFLTLENLTVSESPGHGIILQRQRNGNFKNLHLHHNFRSGINLAASSLQTSPDEDNYFCRVIDVTSHDNGDATAGAVVSATGGDGIVIDAGVADSTHVMQNIIIDNPICYNNTDGIDIQEGAAYVAITNPTLYNNSANGMSAGASVLVAEPNRCKRSMVTGGNINANGYGIRLSDAKKWGVVNVNLHANGNATNKSAIYVSKSIDIRIMGCAIEATYGHGIWAQGMKHSQIIGNTVLNSNQGSLGGGAEGIRLEDNGSEYCLYNTVIGNNCYSDEVTPKATYGIRLGGNSDFNTVIGNILTPNLTAGLAAAGSNNTVRNNTGYKTENYGSNSVADGGSFAHGLALTPTSVSVQGSIAGEMVTITSVDATNVTIAIKKHDGTAGTTQTVYWNVQRRV